MPEDFLHALPSKIARLTPATKPLMPCFGHSEVKDLETPHVSGNPIVVVMPSQCHLEVVLLFLQGFMAVDSAPLVDAAYGPTEARSHSFPLDNTFTIAA